MKTNIQLLSVFALFTTLLFSSCEGDLEYKSYDQLNPTTFFTNETDVKAAVTTIYSGLFEKFAGNGYGATGESWLVLSNMTTDEGVNGRGADQWVNYNKLNFNDSQGHIIYHYNFLIPHITYATLVMQRIKEIPSSAMNETLKARYIAEVKALRAHFSSILYSLYGPVSIVVDPKVALDVNAQPAERPTSSWMYEQIKKDYSEAAEVLPASYPSSEYGRVTRAFAQMGLLKLYMKEKLWKLAIEVGRELEKTSYLMPNYEDIFTVENERNNEIIFSIICKNGSVNVNGWLAHCLPTDFIDPKTNLATPGGYGNFYFFPWKSYDKFGPKDKRLNVLLSHYTSSKGGVVDLRKEGRVGAIPQKYGIDPTALNFDEQGTDVIVWRYADALLLLAEALNEDGGGVAPKEAQDIVTRIRKRAGLSPLPEGLSQAVFRNKIKDERLFELWCEGVRRDDLIRWDDFIKRAIADGAPSSVTNNRILLPIPPKAIRESNGRIKQNPGY